MTEPIPMLLFCPMCNTRHVDEGDFATKPHHTHACQNLQCGMVWRPAIAPTVGVWFLPGFNNGINKLNAWRDQQAPAVQPATPSEPLLYGAYLELHAERTEQRLQWGGAAHDDQHGELDWVTFIKKQLRRSNANYRNAMVKIGALAVAAIESYDRKHRK